MTEQIRILEEIVSHLGNGAKLNWWTSLTCASWKPLLNHAKVAVGQPRQVEHFQSLLTLAQVQAARGSLIGRWQHQVVVIGGPDISQVEDYPEAVASRLRQQINDALNWHGTMWIPIQNQLGELGFRWETFMKEVPPDLSPHGELRRVQEATTNHLLGLLAARLNQAYTQRAEETLKQLQEIAKWGIKKNPAASTLTALIRAASQLDLQGYRVAFERLTYLHQQRPALERRRELIQRLCAHAPDWAAAAEGRKSLHDGAQPPGDPGAAWLWKQLHDELERRAAISIPKLQGEMEQCTFKLQELTARLIDALAWAAQIDRTSRSQRQALIGWQQTIKRIGKGTGRRTPELQAQARRLMSECQTAVPVWIMPLARVAESFDPRVTRFDVVIIDEASQSDAMALLAFYMGHEVLVVGDDQQVSPDAVGQDLGEVKRLIDQYLDGIPNAHLYDGQMSIYDLAKASFGGTICLREHFRCATEIIQFSNHLSYNGTIKPLRDTSLVPVRPHVIAYRVDGQLTGYQINRVEALTIASLVAAAVEQPEYKKNDLGHLTTFGVISLVGDEQARAIDEILRRRLPPVEYERRRILCGNAAQFQGDERDIMFLSGVDARADGPLALREAALFKKRFNVAASRGRNQMWVVYSLDHQVDLKPGDLRRRLIEHALDPSAIERLIERAEARAESELERQVIRRLAMAGYRLLPQVKVGYYRIDLVIEGSNRRLAVECDGDRFHPLEKLQEDTERQAILERLGWVFERVRGSLFFRDPDRALAPVFERLQQLGIEPCAHSDAEQAPNPSGDLKGRVILRAAELRQRWEESEEDIEATEPDLDAQDSSGQELIVGGTDRELFAISEVDGGRTIDDIPAERIRACLMRAVPEAGEIEREVLLRAVCRMIGFDRLGQRIRKRLNRILAGEVRSGRLGTNWGKVWKRRK